MSTVAERLTADAFLARDDNPPFAQLIDGLVVVNQPSVLHQHVCGLLLHVLMTWTETPQGRGTVSLPLDVPLDPHNVLVPDLLWFEGDLPIDSPHAPRVPGLAVEVRSPSTWRYDVGRKRQLY